MIKKINLVRKAIFLKLTSSIKLQSHSDINTVIIKEKIKTVLVIRPNHRLGNLLLVSALINEIENTFSNAKIDLLAKGGLAKIIYKNYDCVNNIYQLPKHPFKHPIKYLSIYFHLKSMTYDLVINAVNNSSSGRIFTKVSKSQIKITDNEVTLLNNSKNSLPSDYKHIAKQQIYQLRSILE
jgi:ADP-heptose:LPS heptosyltransferase